MIEFAALADDAMRPQRSTPDIASAALPQGEPALQCGLSRIPVREALRNRVARDLRLHVSLLHYRVKGQEEHRQILQACAARDGGAAVQLLEQYVGDVANLLECYLQRDGADR